ncbi:GntR family transcriptional regulator [Streptomyces griseofuscus]|uniref:GntR family transcriptional regulator n=1 Tax=Streptomyces TaxID=1883 RepID=UPI0027DB30BD|nr:GntR family transcriptional regulator [Streptomyces sp. CRPSP2-6A1]
MSGRRRSYVPPQARALAATLRVDIESGAWKGDQVYTQVQLCARYGASEFHVYEAVRQLRAQGVVETRSGVGVRPTAADRSWTVPGGVRLATHVGQVIRDRITSRVYPAGEPLPPLRVLVREFEVSRSVIWESTKPLKADGLLLRHPFLGYVVAARHPDSPLASQSPTEQGGPSCIPCP